MIIWKCTDYLWDFFGVGGIVEVGGGVTWEDVSMEKLLMGEETFNEGAQDFFSIIKKKKQWKNK